MHEDVSGLRLPRSTDAVVTLLDAVVAVSRDLDLQEVLSRIVRSACELVGARYGALGVLRPDGLGLMEFVAEGMSAEQIARLAHQPRGAGLLGVLIADPTVLRLADLREHRASVGFPAGHPQMTSFLGAPVRVRGEVFGNLYLTDKIGAEEFTEDDEALVVAFAASAGMAIDNARLYETTHRQQLWSDALSQVSQALLSGRNERDALELLAARAASVADAGMAAVALLDEDGALVLQAVSGPGPQVGTILGTPLTASHWYAVLEMGEPLLLSSSSGESVADPPAALLREATGLPGHGQTAIVPMTVGGRPVGLLVVGWLEEQGHVAYDAAEPLKRYADQAALTLTAATAQQDRARTVLLEDRERIARDMHDVVIQRLFATGLGLQSASRFATHPYVQTRLASAVDELDLAIKDIRSAIFQLHSAGEVSLAAELHELCHGFVGPLGFAPVVRIDAGIEGVVDPLRADVLAVIREGLSNVARHAGAAQASVSVERRDGQLVVAIVDDGAGLGPATRRSGLANLHERAARYGGALRVDPGADRGTSLTWRVPEPA
ncbi:MAG: GAF domain-containing protein [Dermatophilaceae bacterium]